MNYERLRSNFSNQFVIYQIEREKKFHFENEENDIISRYVIKIAEKRSD